MRAGDIPTDTDARLTPGALWRLAKRAVAAWIEDYAPSMGASLAYYTAFSIAPVLVIVIAITGLFFGADAASGYVYAQIAGLLGDEGAAAVRDMVARASNAREGLAATAIGFALLIVGATTVFAELQSDLDRIWKAPMAKRPEGLWALLRARVLSFGLVVSVAFVLLVSLVFSAALAAFGKWWSGALGEAAWLLSALDFAVNIGAVTVVFALMYKILPRVKIGWRDVWIGAAVTSLLFTTGKLALGFYIGTSDVASSFGTAGSLVIVLLWVYWSAQIFLLGAEFTWVYAHAYGSKRGEARPATAMQSGQSAAIDDDALVAEDADNPRRCHQRSMA